MRHTHRSYCESDTWRRTGAPWRTALRRRRTEHGLSLCYPGFTLLEVLVALAIVGILGGLSVAAWDSVIVQQEQGRFPASVRWLMEEARQKAMAENMNTRVYVEWEDESRFVAKSVSWLQLPCSREGGPLSRETCPSTPCRGANLNLSTCIPVARGEKLPVPAGFRLPGFAARLCFLGGSGAYSADCETEHTAPASAPAAHVGHRALLLDGKRPYLLALGALHASIELLNCNNEADAKTPACQAFP